MNPLRILFALTLILTTLLTVRGGIIVPDPQNPFLIYRSSIASGAWRNVLYFNFQLPTDTIGLGYKQTIVAQFPPDTALQTAFATDGDISAKFSCALFDLSTTTPTKISVTAQSASDKTSFNCRIEDLVNTLTSGKNYGLQITFLGTLFPSTPNTFRTISLYTASSSVNSDRIIFDSNPTFADAGLYSDFSTVATPAFGFTSSPTVVTASILSSVTIQMDVIVNSVFKGTETVVMVEFDTTYLKAGSTFTATSVALGSNAAYTNPLTATANPASTSQLLINGLLDDLTSGRSFSIKLDSFTTTDTPGNASVTLWVLYKNSYTVLSYAKSNLVTVSQLSFTTSSATIVDNFTHVRQGGAWNLAFSFTPSATYTPGGYIVIRQKSTTIGVQKINFLASTCDFTPMSTTIVASQNFGVRPICYPLRMNYNYIEAGSTAMTTGGFQGSGIIFKLGTLGNISHQLYVFAFIENCVAQDSTANSPIYNAATTTKVTNIAFQIAFYKSVDLSKSNEARMTGSLISYTDFSTQSVNCYPSIWATNSMARGAFVWGASGTSAALINHYSSASFPSFLYKEINDFLLPYITSTTAQDCLCFFSNMGSPLTTNTNGLKIGSLMNVNTTNNNDLLNGNSYVAVLAQVGTSGAYATGQTGRQSSVCTVIACATSYQSSSLTNLANLKLEWVTTNRIPFFKSITDTSNCYFSWGIWVHNFFASDVESTEYGYNGETDPLPGTVVNTGSLVQAILLNQNTNTATSPYIGNDNTNANSRKNIIANFPGNNFEVATIATTSASPWNIISKAVTNTYVRFPSMISNSQMSRYNYTFYFAVYNSCYKWNTLTTNPVTSVFNYIDIQLNAHEQLPSDTTTFVPTKMNRFFKFVTDTYILDYTRQIVSANDGSIVTWHSVVYQRNHVDKSSYNEWANNGVCMLQITEIPTANNIPSGATSIMVIYLSNLMLLDMDLSDVTSTYPINSSKVNAYALNSLPFYIGYQGATSSDWHHYVWYRSDYASWGKVQNADSETVGMPITYSKGGATTKMNDGVILPASIFVQRTISKLFLGSQLWVSFATGTTSWGASGAFTTDILFPTFCPVQSVLPAVLNNSTKILSYYHPIVNIQFFTGLGYSPSTYESQYVPKLDKNTHGCDRSTLTTKIAGNYCPQAYWVLNTTDNKAIQGTAATDAVVFTALRFNSYLATTNSNTLYICVRCPFSSQTITFGIDFANTTIKTSAAAFFFKESIALDSTTLSFTINNLPASSAATTPNTLWTSTKGKFIYLMGKKFNRVYMSTFTEVTMATSVQTNTSLAGLTRPGIGDNLYTSNAGVVSLYLSDTIAFYMTGSSAGAGGTPKEGIFTNYRNTDAEKNGPGGGDKDFGSFIVDWPWTNINTSSTVSIATATTAVAFDVAPSTVVSSDTASNVKLTLTLPTTPKITLPGSGIGYLLLNMNGITQANSICGINYTAFGSNADACSWDATLSGMGCTLNAVAYDIAAVTICCYGYAYSDPITFPTAAGGSAGSLVIGFNRNFPTSINPTAVTGFNYNLVGSTAASLAISSNSSLTVKAISDTTFTAFKPSISISYAQLQESAYSKATLTVGLGREAVRNSNVVITADFSSFYVGSYVPRCYAVFTGVTDLDANRLIESCSAVFNQSGSGTITVKIGNRVHKCGMKLPAGITITIFPIAVTANQALTYTVAMNFPATGGSNILQTPSTSLTFSNTAMASPTSTAVVTSGRGLANLCSVVSVSPNLVGELGDWNITCDFTKLPNSSILPNELFIFFPWGPFYVQAGGSNQQPICFYANFKNSTFCETVDDNWLRIAFTATAATAGQVFLIAGIPVPIINAASTFAFAANLYDSAKLNRTTLATGTSSFGPNSEPTASGLLRIRQITASSTEPRFTHQLSFNVTLDSSISAPTGQLTGCAILVTLPWPAYPNNFILGNTITATVQEFLSNSTTSTASTISTVEFYTNKINILLDPAAKLYNTNFIYWIITILGVQAPNDAVSVSTGRFRISLTSSTTAGIQNVYRSLSNLQTTFIGTKLTTSADNLAGYNTNNLIQFSRGLTYSFSTVRYVADVTNCAQTSANSLATNYIYLKPGRANSCMIAIRSVDTNTKLDQPALTITTANTIIKLNPPQITLLPANGKVKFLVGSTCSTAPGTYYLNLILSDSKVFYPLPPIVVFIDTLSNAPPSSVTISTLGDTAQAGYQHLPFSFSNDINVDEVSFTFGPDTSATNQTSTVSVVSSVTATGASSTVKVPSWSNNFIAYFQNTASNSTGTFKFVGTSSITCFNSIASFSVGMSANQQVFSNSVTIDSNLDTPSAGTAEGSKNSLSVNYKVDSKFPAYLNCITACSSYNVTDIMVQTLSGFTPSPLIRTFQQYIGASNPATIPVKFTGLVRGLQYVTRCVLSSTQVVAGSRTYTAIAKLSPVNITSTQATSCINYNFLNNDGSTTLKQMLINYCQSFYTSLQNPNANNPNNACIICTDHTSTYFAPGFSFSTSTTCPTSTTGTKLNRIRYLSESNVMRAKPKPRFLQGSSSTSNNTQISYNPSYLFSVCAVQDLICENDLISPGGTKKPADLANDFATKIKDPTTCSAVLGTTTPASFTVTVIGDDGIPTLNFTLPNKHTINSFLTSFSAYIQSSDRLFCQWQISATSQKPSAAVIQSCNPASPNWCGNYTSFTAGINVTYSGNATLQTGTNYTIWASCKKPVGNSGKWSDVVSVYSFLTDGNAQPNTTPVNNSTGGNTTTNNSTTPNNSNQTNNSSKNNSSSYFITLCLILILSWVIIL